MPKFQTTRQVKHSAEDMFRLVADVEAYPQFVPLCEGLRILEQTQEANGALVLRAEMSVGYKHLRECFITRAVLDKKAMRIHVSYLEGPFSYLENNWRFEDTGSREAPASKVHFFIDYEFKSRALGFLMGSVFDKAFKKFAKSFEERADALYGVSAKHS